MTTLTVSSGFGAYEVVRVFTRAISLLLSSSAPKVRVCNRWMELGFHHPSIRSRKATMISFRTPAR